MTLIKSSENSYSVVLDDPTIGTGETKHAACSNAMATLKAAYVELNDMAGMCGEKLDEITKGITGE